MMRFRLWLSMLLFLLVAVSASGQPTPGGPPAVQVVIPAAPAGTPAVGQITVSTSATLIRSASTNRSAIIVVNHGTTNVFLGFTNGVTTANGVMLVGVPGSSLTFQTRTDIWAIVSAGSQAVGFYEEIR